MARLAGVALFATALVGAAKTYRLDNGAVVALVDPAAGLVGFGRAGSKHQFKFSGDSWELQLDGQVLRPEGCQAGGAAAAPDRVALNYTCGSLTVEVAYALRPGGAFVEKRLAVEVTAKTSFFGAALLQGLAASLDTQEAPTWFLRANPFASDLQIAGFARWPQAGQGLFVSITNPWGKHDGAVSGSQVLLTASFSGQYEHDPALQGPWLSPEPAVLGLTTLEKFEQEGVNVGELTAFTRCVEAYLLDGPSRANRTVKVNVAWDENDYQIDVATEEGRQEYRRIIDRNAELGVTHIVYEPQNSLHGSRFNATDGWGWETSLWFTMGEKIRAGLWDPRTDPMPEDILEMQRYAAAKGVKLMAYAYPCLRFEKVKDYFVAEGPNSLSLAPPQVQQYFIEVMTAIMEKMGAGGFAWDHDIFAGGSENQYAQWRGWMNILAALREKFPDLVMDHRQTNHVWGPWYQLAGSYAEPIAGDENPESYGIPVPSLHTDHVAADNMRRINYIFATQQLLPPSRVPGFIFHQTERTDDDGHYYCTVNEPLCVNNSNTRDFDYMGYKYSLLSSIGTAGLNNVVTMIPARDPAEFELFPKEDLAFIRDWLAWTDQHIEALSNTRWIPTLPPPGTGGIDGTHSVAGDEGFLFLFNPNFRELAANLTVDEAIGLAGSGSEWAVEELYPSRASLATWRFGEAVSVSVSGAGARVLQLRRRSAPQHVRLLGAGLRGAIVKAAGSELALTGVVEAAGQQVTVAMELQGPVPTKVSVNDVKCEGEEAEAAPQLALTVTFAGKPVQQMMPVGPAPPPGFTGGWFNTTFSIPQAVKLQLAKRAEKYPVPWTKSAEGCGQPHCVDDSRAPWLIPHRLLLLVALAHPNDAWNVSLTIDGKAAEVQKAYNSRGIVIPEVFVGFYFDATDLAAEVSHEVQLLLPDVGADQFQGLFWENLETEFTSTVHSCHVGSASRGKEVLFFL